eukprot:m.229784 g.229784  ORF g.229784 m.229784 type:complete len:230 (+) comp10865_c0_seq12:1433-2122(+)
MLAASALDFGADSLLRFVDFERACSLECAHLLICRSADPLLVNCSPATDGSVRPLSTSQGYVASRWPLSPVLLSDLVLATGSPCVGFVRASIVSWTSSALQRIHRICHRPVGNATPEGIFSCGFCAAVVCDDSALLVHMPVQVVLCDGVSSPCTALLAPNALSAALKISIEDFAGMHVADQNGLLDTLLDSEWLVALAGAGQDSPDLGIFAIAPVNTVQEAHLLLEAGL